MTVSISNITFFFGAGASAPFGIPTMKKMTEDFTHIISSDGTSKEKALYNEIIEFLKLDLGNESVDIEAIFSVIEGLKNYNAESLGELALYSSRKKFNKSLLNLAENRELISDLETRFQQFIRKSCRLKDDYRVHIERVYSHFFNIFEKLGGQRTYEGGVIYHPHWKIFTTNYDRCLEAFWREDARCEITTGFMMKGVSSISTMDADNFVKEIGRLHIIKLHGSTTWLKRVDIGEIEEKEYDIDLAREVGSRSKFQEELVIYPLSQKQLYIEPYLQMFYRLNKELLKNDVWIVIGYSFRDPIIRNIFIKCSNTKKNLLIIHPHSNLIKQKLFECNAKIIEIPEYFGKEGNYEEVNKTILDKIINIS